MAGEESLLPLPTREAALTILDQSWSSSSQHPLTSLLSSLLTPLTPRRALPAKEKAVTLTWAAQPSLRRRLGTLPMPGQRAGVGETSYAPPFLKMG